MELTFQRNGMEWNDSLLILHIRIIWSLKYWCWRLYGVFWMERNGRIFEIEHDTSLLFERVIYLAF